MSTCLFDPIKTMSRVADSVIVAFSAGKDSIVMLDLAMRYMKHVTVFFKYYVPNLEFEERTIRWYENHYGIDIIRVPNDQDSMMFRYGFYTRADPEVPIVSHSDIYDYIRLKTGYKWLMTGERANESLQRRGIIAECGSINRKTKRMYPMAYWKPTEVNGYIKHHKLYLPPTYKEKKRSIGALQDIGYIKERYPNDYAKIISLFPFAGAMVTKGEINGKDQISSI